MAGGRICSPLLVLLICTVLAIAAARVGEHGEAEEVRRKLLKNGLGQAPQMGCRWNSYNHFPCKLKGQDNPATWDSMTARTDQNDQWASYAGPGGWNG
ncbi:hypothetical protein Dsin_028748 [Dipteronia sinensis]|uniref:Uncharacterized protein n=1 Tax=Dipteronia sinensis TaxID=43782 RepID=A0AAD9ZSG0_9ROSI|nr:hypothetical protein Dsin_028748 [Dipteronia sinensis]